MNGEHLTRDEMEARRLKAVKLFRAGVSPALVGIILNVSRTSAGRWRDAFREEGVSALKTHPAPGRPRKLDEWQRGKLEQLCRRGPRAVGYDRDHWTLALLTTEIQERFDVRYDPDHVGKMLHQMGVEWMPRPRQKARHAR